MEKLLPSNNSKFLIQSYKEYLQYIDNCISKQQYLTYDFEFLENKKWYMMGETFIHGNMRELTNLMNSWQKHHSQWEAWNHVLKNQDEMNSWNIRAEFVEPLVHQCLLQPSRIRDTFTSIATNALHQIKLSIDNSYKDYLEGEQTSPDQQPKFLNRKEKEKLLSKLANNWSDSTLFMQSLRNINNSQYIKETSNYRNLASHYISPNLELGETSIITRTVVPSTKLVPKGDGTYEDAFVSGKMSVSYGFGGTEPLNLITTKEKNYEQYNLARKCYLAYRELLEVAVNEIKNA